MSLQEIRTFKDIQDAVMDRAKLEDTPDVRRQIKEKINTTYVRIGYEDFYTWSGYEFHTILKKRYMQGTISVVQGSDEVTGTSTLWNENDHLFLNMKIAGASNPFKIIRVGDLGTITLDQPWLGETAFDIGYEIFQSDIGLPPDCQAVRKVTIASQVMGKPIRPIGPTEMDSYRGKAPFYGGIPRYYTIWGKSHYRSKTWENFNINEDFWEDSFEDSPRNLNMIVWPAVRTLDVSARVRCTKVICPMDKDDDEPVIPFYNRSVLVWGCLYDHFIQNRDRITSSLWKGEYNREHSKMQAEIETYDDELILKPDSRSFGWSSRFGYSVGGDENSGS